MSTTNNRALELLKEAQDKEDNELAEEINEGLGRQYGTNEIPGFKGDTHINLQSTVNQMGETVTQILHFKGGGKLTFNGIITNSIKQGQFTKLRTTDGRMIMINDKNVNAIEIFSEK